MNSYLMSQFFGTCVARMITNVTVRYTYYSQRFATVFSRNQLNALARIPRMGKRSLEEAQPLSPPWRSAPRAPFQRRSSSTSPREMITGKGAPKRDPLAPIPAVSLATPYRGPFLLSLVIIITDARVHASAMERVDRRTARRRRRRR